jgi:multidrug efflux pump subunit AcrB
MLSQYLVRREDRAAGNETTTEQEKTSVDADPDMASLLAAEDATGFFSRVMAVYERAMQTVLARPWILVASFVAIVVLSLASYKLLGSDLLPEMDEGGFILDYITPPGSSLAESNRILLRIEKILRSTPEVETTSRRTGLQLGLAAVTEANSGDFTVKLKSDRKRAIDDIISDIRSQIEGQEPATKVEFIQLLQDMIGDLTSQPEPAGTSRYQVILARWKALERHRPKSGRSDWKGEWRC